MSVDTGEGVEWRIELLGGLRVGAASGEMRPLQRQKPALLLAYLALAHSGGAGAPRARLRGGPASQLRETLIECLWPETDPDAGRNNLRFVLHSLRHLLEPPGTPPGTLLIADNLTICLNPASVTTD